MVRPFRSIEWKSDSLVLLDQKKLPHEVNYKMCSSVNEVFDAIVDMTVRGAPAIGIAAAYGVVIGAIENKDTVSSALEGAKKASDLLRRSRPTAVNLFWALDKMNNTIADCSDRVQNSSVTDLIEHLVLAANQIFQDDVETNLSIARYGFELIPDGASIIHHCNTGSLATADYGTALGVIRYAHEQGKKIHVYLDETRPRMQGASLSAFEMKSFGVPHTVIIDSASGFLMRQRKIDLCIVGCDRVCVNGDTANKIGTYNLSIAAKEHSVPFYVAAPISTIDTKTADGSLIEIEERSADEILKIQGIQIAPEGTSVWNPAFDVTPGSFISGFITEKGIKQPPFIF
jgi:methylthioribose-1-phosphate isomerase